MRVAARKENSMKIKLGKGSEVPIYGENENGTYVMGVIFSGQVSKKKLIEIKKALAEALKGISV